MKISKFSLNIISELKHEELALKVHAILNERGCLAELETVRFYAAQARSYDIHDEREITVYIESILKIKKSGYDISRIEKLMSNRELSRDHKLIPLRMLADSVGKEEC